MHRNVGRGLTSKQFKFALDKKRQRIQCDSYVTKTELSISLRLTRILIVKNIYNIVQENFWFKFIISGYFWI